MQRPHIEELHRSRQIETIYGEGLWTRYVIMALGLWMIAVPLSFTDKSSWMAASDIISGLLLLGLGAYSLKSHRQTVTWSIAIVGVWLQFAPLLFWAPETFSYLNDTLVGAFVITMAVIIPKNPLEEILEGEEIPPGWSYNPSAWTQRIPIIFLGFLAWMFARYMAAYQLGYLDSIWDPVFGDGTEKVITSKVSKAFPIPDAGLGAMAYTLETLMAAHGGTRRWYTIPWFVVAFAILVVPLGFTSILLIMLQPIVVGYWCFWCLLTAVCMLFMIALAIDEVVAVLQHLHTVYKDNRDQFWNVFWRGSDLLNADPDERSPSLNDRFSNIISSMIWGVRPTWNMLLTALIGGYLMFSPKLLNITGLIADLDHIIGALTVAISVIAFAEVVRSARYISGFFGLVALLIAPFLGGLPMISHLAAGVALIVFCLPKGKIKERYGTWGKWIF